MNKIDCNFCSHISLTEKQQKRTSNTESHICYKYQKRVVHRANYKNHDDRLYPCIECMENNGFEAIGEGDEE